MYYFMLMSTCPKTDDIDWTMEEICDHNDIDRADIQADEERTRYRAILDTFETTVFEQQSKDTSSRFLFKVLDLVRPHFDSDLVKVQQIEYTDTYALTLFLQKVYSKFLEFSHQIQLNGH